MQRSVFSVAGRNCTLLGQPDAGPLLIQPVNGQEEELLEKRYERCKREYDKEKAKLDELYRRRGRQGGKPCNA